MYVSGFEASLEGWNPAWVERFDTLYGYNPSRAKELLKEAGYLLARFTSNCSPTPVLARRSIHRWSKPWRSILTRLGSNPPSSRWTRGKSLACGGTRRQQARSWSNIIGLRPTEEWIRTSNYSKGPGHNFEDPFIDEHYLKAHADCRSQRTATPRQGHSAITYSKSSPICPCCCCIMRSWPIQKSSRGGPIRGRALDAARISIC